MIEGLNQIVAPKTKVISIGQTKYDFMTLNTTGDAVTDTGKHDLEQEITLLYSDAKTDREPLIVWHTPITQNGEAKRSNNQRIGYKARFAIIAPEHADQVKKMLEAKHD